MKKKFALLALSLVSLLIAGTAVGNFYLNRSESFDFTTSHSITNRVGTRFQVSGLTCDFSGSTICTVSVYRVRSYIPSFVSTRRTNNGLLRAFEVLSSSNFFATAEEFDGFYFNKGDVLRIEDNSGAGITNFTNLDLEDIR